MADAWQRPLYSPHRIVWTLAEVRELLAGSAALAALMRHSRDIPIAPLVPHPFITDVVAWAEANSGGLCVVERLSPRSLRVLFEHKADLAKFILACPAFATGPMLPAQL